MGVLSGDGGLRTMSHSGFHAFKKVRSMGVEQKFAQAVFVIGPTASGKTALAHQLFEQLQSELKKPCQLVNIDAFQFYRSVSIGVAKPTSQEISSYGYRGIDILEPLGSMDAARYAEFVWGACREISDNGRLPVCVGGSGLYLRSVLHGLDPLPERNDALRQMFRASAQAWGWPALHGWLKTLAPLRAAQLHPNDKTRIERALEIVFQLPEGVAPESVFQSTQTLAKQELLGSSYVIRVDCDDDVLRRRIASRIDAMFASGWLSEVKNLQQQFGAEFALSQAGKAIGYREIIAALAENEAPDAPQISELKARIATLTWQYVRRQRTWNAKERFDWEFDSTDGIAKIQFPASFLSFLDHYHA
jgi:tRNA dimethylallyltransferase